MGAERARRRFYTTRDVEDARAAGRLLLGPRDVITDEARQRARDLGVEIVRGDSIPAPEREVPRPVPVPTPEPEAPKPVAVRAPEPEAPKPVAVPTPEPERKAILRAAVLEALRDEVGHLDGLEQIVDAILAREDV